MSNSVCAVIYSDRPKPLVPWERLNRLRILGKYFDLKITTLEGHKLAAHRAVFFTRFPHIEDALTQHEPAILQWRRYTTSIVKAVIIYAYTGSITISMNNVGQLFLLATNLGCSRLVSWCIDFLESRLQLNNVELFWKIANVTTNEDLADVCVAVIADHFATLARRTKFIRACEPEYLATILRDERLDDVPEKLKLDLLLAWLVTGSQKKNPALQASFFENLISIIDLKQIPKTFMEGLLKNNTAKLSEECRNQLSNAWDTAMRPISPVDSTTSSHLEIGSFASVRIDDNRNLVVTMFSGLNPYRKINFSNNLLYLSKYVAFDGSIYFIGGRRKQNTTVSSVVRVDLTNNHASEVHDMRTPRFGHCVAANDQRILVFGGIGKKDKCLSSCEKYNPLKNKWSSLPDMPEAKAKCAAVCISSVGVIVVGGGKVKKACYRNAYQQTAHLLIFSPEKHGKRYWLRLAPMLTGRCEPAVAFFNSRVIVAGGNRGDQINVESLCLRLDDGVRCQWTQLRGLKTGNKPNRSLAVFDDRLLLAGGQSLFTNYLSFSKPFYKLICRL
uniref:BACK domain-containing protein n=1 Tax=Mesocestoides corti TaxID=53468 RepID=A0A5K3FRN2_MESCO